MAGWCVAFQHMQGSIPWQIRVFTLRMLISIKRQNLES